MKNLIGTFDQIFVSGCRFILAVFLAREFGPETFGLYSVYIIGVTFAIGIQSPLIITPLFQIGYRKEFEFKTLFSNVLYSSYIFSIFSCFALLVCYIYFDRQQLFLTSCFVIYAFLSLQVEIIRKVLIFKNHDKWCLIFDVGYYSCLLVGLSYLWLASKLSLQNFFLLFVLPGLLMCLFLAFVVIRIHYRSLNKRLLIQSLNIAKPFISSTLANLISGHYFLFIIAAVIDLSSVGGFNAIKTLVGPLVVLLMTVDHLVYRNAARSHEMTKDLNASFRILDNEIRPYYAICALCFLISLLFYDDIVYLSYGDSYESFSNMLPLLMATVAVQLASKHISLKLRLSEKLTVIQDGNFLVLYVSLLLMPLVICQFGFMGAFLGLFIQQLLLLIFYHKEVKGKFRILNMPITFGFKP